jgi:hypothetical protein
VPDTWIQFALLMVALLTVALRNEHRITLLEGQINTEREMRKANTARLDKLEAKIP